MYRSSNLIEGRKCLVETSKRSYLINSLYEAVLDGDTGTVGFLLEFKKVNPNIVLEEYDAAPLHSATGIGTEDLGIQIVQLLLTYGADPNIKTSDGTTPMMVSCIWGRPDIFKLLLKYGGNPHHKDMDGMSPIDYAVENGNYFMLRILNDFLCEGGSSILSNDETGVGDNSVAKLFFSYFEGDFSTISSHVKETDAPFSEIESEAHCIEFGELDIAFRKSSNSELTTSSTGSFVSIPSRNETFWERQTNGAESLVRKKESSSPSETTSPFESVKNTSSELSAISYRTDRIKLELKYHNINHGPVTSTTKKVYYNLIKKVIKGKNKGPFNIDEFSNFPEVVRSTFKIHFSDTISKWTNLEQLMSKNFSDSNRIWRGGKDKQFFTYLLLDPFITNMLSSRKEEVEDIEIWKTFLLSIFYVGKGKNARPFSHLYEALRTNFKKTVSKKVTRIQNIWESSSGVICLHIFHNVISAEAHTREASMIDAIGLSNLTNIQSGEYYGITKNWNAKEKQQLGVVLLHKALQIYLAEGERQIFPSDLK